MSGVLQSVSEIGSLSPSGVEAEVCAAFQGACQAAGPWRATPVRERLRFLRNLRPLLADHAAELAEVSAAQRQRPSLESLTSEVLPLVEACRFLERKAEALLAPRRLGRRGLPLWLTGVDSVIHRDPLGVVLIIGPGNYPLLLPGVQMLQALVAGNAVVVKPGVGGFAPAKLLARLLAQAGFNPSLFPVLTESTETSRFCIEACPDKVLFTGSASTGEVILSQLASRLIPSVMELSGSDAVIVRADADLDLVARALAFGLSLNGGATCLAPRRVFVQPGQIAELERRLIVALNVRHLSTESQRSKQERREMSESDLRARSCVREALREGARLVWGTVDEECHWTRPLVLSEVRTHSSLLREDIFAPLLSLVAVSGDGEAVDLANSACFALGASVFSRDEAAATLLAARIQAGSICINDLIVPTADARAPFGGRRRSGWGVTRGAEGLLELTAAKVVSVTRGSFRPAFDPPHPNDETLFLAYLRIVHSHGWRTRCSAFKLAVRLLMRRSRVAPRTPSNLPKAENK